MRVAILVGSARDKDKWISGLGKMALRIVGYAADRFGRRGDTQQGCVCLSDSVQNGYGSLKVVWRIGLVGFWRLRSSD